MPKHLINQKGYIFKFLCYNSIQVKLLLNKINDGWCDILYITEFLNDFSGSTYFFQLLNNACIHLNSLAIFFFYQKQQRLAVVDCVEIDFTLENQYLLPLMFSDLHLVTKTTCSIFYLTCTFEGIAPIVDQS